MIQSAATFQSIGPDRQLLSGRWVASLGEAPAADMPGRVVTVSQAAGRHLLVTAPSAEERPAFATVAHCGAVLDGWLYNRAALLAQFAADADASNAELALQAYLRWGPDALHKLEGIFALCIWDGRTSTLLCARDRLGVYPLFYARVGAQWLFSTSVDALLSRPGVSPTINTVALATYLLRQYRDIEETCFSSVRRIPPGHVLNVQTLSDTARVARYWNPLAAGPVRWVGEGDLDQFQEVMKRAIGRCLQLGKAGIYLSGGLDSGTIATLATDYAKDRLLPVPHAISLIYADGEANEERLQRGIAGSLGLSQTLVPFEDPGDDQGAFRRSLRANSSWPHPFALGLSPLHLTTGRHALEAGCDVVLSGEGGDEWLAVHPCLTSDYMRRLDAMRVYRMWAMTRAITRVPWYRAAQRALWRSGLRPLLKQGRDRLLPFLRRGALRPRSGNRASALSLPEWLAPDPQLRAVLEERAAERAAPDSRTFYEREVMTEILDQPLTVLYKEDTFESSRRSGLLMLEPFYDPDVISFLVRTPPWLRTRGGRSKGLLRRILHQRHPHLGYDQQRKPYATDLLTRKVFGGAREVWPAWQGARGLGELGVVDVSQMDALIGGILRAEDAHQTQRLWMSLCAEAWVRTRLGLPCGLQGSIS